MENMDKIILDQIKNIIDSSMDSIQDKFGLNEEPNISENPINLYNPAMDKDPPIRVHILHLGDTLVDESNIFAGVVKTINPSAPFRIGRDHKKFDIRIPCTAYLIEHPKGRVIIDTGFHSCVRTDPISELTAFHANMNPPLQKKGQAIDEVLVSKGLRPEDIDYVVLSHMHPDHVSGLRLLKGAKKILVSDLEFAAAQQNKRSYLPHM